MTSRINSTRSTASSLVFPIPPTTRRRAIISGRRTMPPASTSTSVAPGPFSAAVRIRRRCLDSMSFGATPWAPIFRRSDCSRSTELSTRAPLPTGRKTWSSANSGFSRNSEIGSAIASGRSFRLRRTTSSVQKLPHRLRRLQSGHQRSYPAARQRARRLRRV